MSYFNLLQFSLTIKTIKIIYFYIDIDESEDDSQPTPAPIRHWPTLDLLITMTYKLGDFISCLSYIDVALNENPDFEKGHKLKKRIYDECPYIDPDPKNWNKEPDFSRIKFSSEPKSKVLEKTPLILNFSQWNLKTLATTFFERYKVCGDTQLLLEPCLVKFESKPIDEKNEEVPIEKSILKSNTSDSSQQLDDDEVVILGSDDDIVILDDSDENDITIEDAEDEDYVKISMQKIVDSVVHNVISRVYQRDNEQSFEIVSPIVSEIVESVEETSTKAFIQRILHNLVDSSVTENYSFINNLSSASKRKAGLSQFLSQVPLDLIEKRRSTRAKGTPVSGVGDKSVVGTSGENTLSSPRCEEVTAKQLLQGYFPGRLLKINHGKSIDLTHSPEKKSTEENVTTNNTNSSTTYEERNNQKWLSNEQEKEFTQDFITTYCSTSRWTFLTQLEELLAIAAHKLGDRIWPREFCRIYLKCYVKWRGHTSFPDEFEPQEVPHRFIPVIIIANEILLQTKINENSQVDTI